MSRVSFKRRKNIIFVSLVLASLLLGFQNCSSTSFIENTRNSDNSGSGTETPETSTCPQTKAPFAAMSVTQDEVGEGHEILSYRVSEIHCGQTAFLVKVKAYGQFETFLAFRKNHSSDKNELLTVTADGLPEFIYEAGFSVSSDGRSVIYIPQKIVDRAMTYPEFIVRRDLFSKKTEIINQNENGKLIPLPKNPNYLNQRISESKDGMIVLFLAQGQSSIYRKNLITGELLLLNQKFMTTERAKPIVKSFALDETGSLALYHQTNSATESLLVLNKENEPALIFEGNGNTKIYDGIDTVVIQDSILSADGNFALFEGKYEGGRRLPDLNYYLIRKDLKTGESVNFSLYKDSKSGEMKPISGANLQSVSADGNLACFLAKPSKLKDPVKTDVEVSAASSTDLTTEHTMAYVKNISTGDLKLVSVNEAGLPIEGSVMSCTIDPIGHNVSYEVHPVVSAVREANSNSIDANDRYDRQIKVYQNSY